MNSIITNRTDEAAPRSRIGTESVFVYEPRHESDWSYSHHASIVYFKGSFYAIWSNGRVHEDDPGQRVLLSTSPDFYRWTKPEPLADIRMGEHSELVLTAAGFHEHAGTLTAYFGQYEYAKENIENGHATKIGRHSGHRDTSLWAMTTTDGANWSEPQNISVPIVPNHGPQKTASGRLIISGNIMFPYTDDPAGRSGWRTAGIYDRAKHDGICDDSEFFWEVAEKQGWPVGLCEGSFYQTDDGTIRMLLRATGPGFAGKLWATESRDDGETWSPPAETDFSDNNTKFHFGRLPDGRFYYVGSPDPLPRGRRNPLVLSVSEDGVRFDKHYILGDETFDKRFEGMHKGGTYGYPHTLVHDGYLYVIVSIWKERVAVIRTHIDSIR